MIEIRIFEAFAGYGSQLMALRRLEKEYPDQIKVTPIGISEIEKNAVKAYKAVHGEVPNYGDISKIDWSQVPDFDLFTYSSPCQDFSNAGLQRGGEAGSGTRSSLLWECERAIAAKKTKYLLMENVAALVQAKFIRLFNKWQNKLESYGYKNFAMVLNAKNYNVPQNRERIFMVSILDENAKFEFPQPIPLTRKLKDVLEKDVDERYYLSDDKIKSFELISQKQKEKNGGKAAGIVIDARGGVFYTLSAGDNAKLIEYGEKDNQQERIKMSTPKIIDDTYANRQPRLYEENAPTIRSEREGLKVVEQTIIANTGASADNTNQRTAHQQSKSSSPQYNNAVKQQMIFNNGNIGFRVRRLTCRELFRLMDVSEEDIDKIQSAGISKTQQAKMAGNSIVVNCMFHIFRKLFIDNNQENQQLKLF
jgi:DNA (cytosine-5)-methyltransferase 1